MTKENESAKSKAPGGRKPLVEGTVALPVTIKLTPQQKDKLQRLGGAPWVRARIDKAKEPEPKE